MVCVTGLYVLQQHQMETIRDDASRDFFHDFAEHDKPWTGVIRTSEHISIEQATAIAFTRKYFTQFKGCHRAPSINSYHTCPRPENGVQPLSYHRFVARNYIFDKRVLVQFVKWKPPKFESMYLAYHTQ